MREGVIDDRWLAVKPKSGSGSATTPISAAFRVAQALEVFDSHLHIVDPRFPLVAEPGLRAGAVHGLRLPRAHGGDRPSSAARWSPPRSRRSTSVYLIDALERLGAGFVGVTQLPPDRLRRGDPRARPRGRPRGALQPAPRRRRPRRGARLSRPRAGRLARRGLRRTARPGGARGPAARAAARGHRPPRPPPPTACPPSCASSSTAPRSRRAGFGRVELDVAPTLRAIVGVDPGALLFGTDLPACARRGRSPQPTSTSSPRSRPLAPAANPLAWYGLSRPARSTPR